MLRGPCLGCKVRKLGCHGKCGAYKAQQERQRAINAARVENREADEYKYILMGKHMRRRMQKGEYK